MNTNQRWIGLAVLALPTLLLSLDVSVLYLALPQLSADLGASSTEQLWILDIYGFLIAGCLVTMGSIGDRIGRRRLLLLGTGAFAAASALAAYAPNPALLIGARALLGVAGATLMPSTLALIRSLFPDERRRTMAIAVWMTTFSAGVALGDYREYWADKTRAEPGLLIGFGSITNDELPLALDALAGVLASGDQARRSAGR